VRRKKGLCVRCGEWEILDREGVCALCQVEEDEAADEEALLQDMLDHEREGME